MALIVKIMGGEDASDEDSRKTFQLFSGIAGCDFIRNEGDAPLARLEWIGGEVVEYAIEGNVYVMNENGKTVASFGASPIPG